MVPLIKWGLEIRRYDILSGCLLAATSMDNFLNPWTLDSAKVVEHLMPGNSQMGFGIYSVNRFFSSVKWLTSILKKKKLNLVHFFHIKLKPYFCNYAMAY